MNIDEIDNDKLLWYVIVHLTFVVSTVLMGILEYYESRNKKDSDYEPGGL